MTKDEALKLALETLISCEMSNYGRDWVWPVSAHEQSMKDVKEAITAIKEALAHTQEPVDDDIKSIIACRDMLDAQPVQRTWVGLTDDEVIDIFQSAWTRVQAVEITAAKLKAKNT